MLGNSDEYFEYGDVSIKDQYAQSLLKTKKPDNVARAKFLAKKGGISTNDKLKTQQATFDLAEKAGTDLPEFDSKSSSIMSAGADVLPLHYLPIWEVLGKITAPTIKPEEWKIG
jgi:adenine-specific DNA methylase